MPRSKQPPLYQAVFWVLRIGPPWRDLPPDYGDGSNTHRRFIRWRNQNVCAELQKAPVDDPDGDLPDTGPGCGPKWFDCTP